MNWGNAETTKDRDGCARGAQANIKLKNHTVRHNGNILGEKPVNSLRKGKGKCCGRTAVRK